MDYQHHHEGQQQNHAEEERAVREALAETLRAGASLAEEKADERTQRAFMNLSEKATSAPACSMLELSAESAKLFRQLRDTIRVR